MNTRIITPHPNPHYCLNKIKTTRYNLFTWAPLSLIYQFRRINNVYFLIISVLSLFKFSPKNPWSLISTFSVVLFFTMLKEGYEDLNRLKQDNETNRSQVLKLDRILHKFVSDKSENIAPGDIVQVLRDQSIPADLLLISVGDNKSVAFVNTMNLDGETNLKEKKQVQYLENKDLAQLSDLSFSITSETPNADLYKWSATLDTPENTQSVSIQNLLLRGSVLKNTDYILGLTIFTGPDTKIVMNSKKPPFKSSNIHKKMNKILYTIFALQLAICTVFAASGQVWEEEESSSHTYLDLSEVPIGAGIILRIFTYLVAYSHLIPISLYVALELVKLFLSWVIENDLEMYYDELGKPAQVRSSDLVEELGQVSFIFTDKTGTLTNNEMVFKKLYFNEQIEENEAVMCTLFGIVLCNSVFPAYHQDVKEFLATSPDELALVRAAEQMQVCLVSKIGKNVKIDVKGEQKEFEVLEECPFDSDRKRMSVVVRDLSTSEVILFTKGADSAMFKILELADYSEMTEKINGFAREALRTLVFSMKRLDNWKELQEVFDSKKSKFGEDLSVVWDGIERNSKFLAVSALEDKLQSGVSDTIDLLLEAGIKIWMLTGDKEETAIEIAKSCKLFKESVKIFEIFTDSMLDTITAIENLGLENLNSDFGLAINGSALSFILSDRDLKDNFMNIALKSKSCVCCRVSPFQKSEVVKMGKTSTTGLTLSIGDGANDVSMIQEAHIGIGISGKEGTQAVQAADFSISQFAYLTHLLLHHGRLAYKRVSLFILYYFYKNFTSAFTEVWFAFFSAFSGQIFFLDWLPQLYNTFWTSWPCLTICSLEQDLPRNTIFENPQIYQAGHKSVYFNIKRFWCWVLSAIFHSVICFFVPVFGLHAGINSSGEIPWLWFVSFSSFTVLIHTVNLKLIIESNFWNKYSM